MGLGSFFRSSSASDITRAGFELANCDVDCDDCHTNFPRSVKFQDDDGKQLWKSTKPYGLHLVISTGKVDWQHNALDNKFSLEALVDKFLNSYSFPDGEIKVSVSSIAPSSTHDDQDDEDDHDHKSLYGDILILPFFVWVRKATKDNIADVLTKLLPLLVKERELHPTTGNDHQILINANSTTNGISNNKPLVNVNQDSSDVLASLSTFSKLSINLSFVSSDFLEDGSNVDVSVDNSYAYVFLCSHTTRDKRCGITAPIMKKEFEFHLRDFDLYRDASDSRPNGVKIAFINHVGGHKFAANVLMYTKKLGKNIWLARCTPNNVKPIIEQSLLLGKVWPQKVRIVQQFKGIEW
jgi:hypothetical protein